MATLTFAVYVGSSIYSAGITGPNPDSVTLTFNVSVTTGLVGLTVFVLGYGIGPMIWAPILICLLMLASLLRPCWKTLGRA